MTSPITDEMVEAGVEEIRKARHTCFDRWTDHDVIRAVLTAGAAPIISELRAKLFPYADATEISGISWDGKYLIGDKASIKFFHEMKNRGEQIDVYKRAYDERLAAKDAEIARLREALDECEDYFDNRADADCDQDGYIPNEEMKLLHVVMTALAGGSDA